ncbi:MAG TPA: hypothetical protein VL860_11360 [Planctomycetota bacterium]|nr:hypothetical protein [Planctomycetota bacterium]
MFRIFAYLAWFLSAALANACAADTASIAVHVAAAPELNGQSLAPSLLPIGTAMETCIRNGAALRPYYVLPDRVFADLEASAAAYAATHAGANPHVQLPAEIHPPRERIGARQPRSPTQDYVGTVPPGQYDLCIPIGLSSFVWRTNLAIKAGGFTAEVPVELPGSVRLTWMLDYPIHKEASAASLPVTINGLQDLLRRSPLVGLLRDGRVWASARLTTENEFVIEAVPPGTYTLVFQSAWERFLYCDEKVVVISGAETAIKADIKRVDQAGIGLTCYDPVKNTYPKINASLRLMDEKLGVAFQPSSEVRKTESDGGLAAEFFIAEYGGLSPTAKYLIYLNSPGFKPVTGQPIVAARQNNLTPLSLGKGVAKAPVEEYKATILRLATVSAIGGGSRPVETSSLQVYSMYMAPPAK